PRPGCEDEQEPVQTPTSTASVCGGQISQGKIWDYCNAARSGKNWNNFTKVLNNLKNALTQDPDCANWLFSTDKGKNIKRTLKNLSGYFAVADSIINGDYV